MIPILNRKYHLKPFQSLCVLFTFTIFGKKLFQYHVIVWYCLKYGIPNVKYQLQNKYDLLAWQF